MISGRAAAAVVRSCCDCSSRWAESTPTSPVRVSRRDEQGTGLSPSKPVRPRSLSPCQTPMRKKTSSDLVDVFFPAVPIPRLDKEFHEQATLSEHPVGEIHVPQIANTEVRPPHRNRKAGPHFLVLVLPGERGGGHAPASACWSPRTSPGRTSESGWSGFRTISCWPEPHWGGNSAGWADRQHLKLFRIEGDGTMRGYFDANGSSSAGASWMGVSARWLARRR